MLLKDMSRGSVTAFRVAAIFVDLVLAGLVVVYFLLNSSARDVMLIVLLAAGPVLLLLSAIFWRISFAPTRYRQFLERGVRGTATVKDAKRRGVINGVPILRLELEVNVPGKPPYKAFDKIVAYPGSIARDQVFECIVDPKKPERVVIQHQDSMLKEPSAL
jgi:predicted membrane channel-forming protein YqfA (hemolysin III family)